MSEQIAYRFKSRGLDPEQTLVVMAFQGQEAVSRPYEFTIELKSRATELDLDALLSSRCQLDLSVGGKTRSIHGVLASFEELNQTGEFTFYRAVLVPRFWQLSFYRTNEVYLEQTVPEIIEAVLQEGGLTGADYELRLMRSYRSWPYRCQFGESHLDFVSRLMEHEGIYYYFVQDGDADKLIVSDHRQFHDDLPEAKVRYSPPSGMDLTHFQDKVHSLVCRQTRLPHKLILRDYNDDNPSVDIRGEAIVDDRGLGEVYDYGDNIDSPEEGKTLADIRAEQLRAGKRVFHGDGMVARLQPGFLVQLEAHFRDSFNQRYLVTAVEHEGSVPSLLAAEAEARPAAYSNSFTAIAADQQFRPERKTAKPRFYGTLNAVVDAEGDGQYAEIDELGRYKVVLSFDRVRRQEGKASCWIRMAQPYAGQGEGMHFPLRKGSEVLLTFIGGDPDRPVISGAVPNARNPSVVNADNQTNGKIQTAGGNYIELEDREDSRRVKLYSPHKNSYLHLGAHNAPGDGIVAVTEGLYRQEFGGGTQLTAVSKLYFDGWTASADAKLAGNRHADNEDTSDDQLFNEQEIFPFQIKNAKGEGGTGMTPGDEISGNYHIRRTAGDQYVWTDGNEYIYGGGRVFNFGGGGYEETHAREDGIEQGERFDIPSTMPGAVGYAPDQGFVEKLWGDTYTYQSGNNYAWGDTKDYAFGNSYAENHVDGGQSVGGSYDHDNYSGRSVTIDPATALVEKTLGNSYGYTGGDTLEVCTGDSEEQVYGDLYSQVFGKTNDWHFGQAEVMFMGGDATLHIGADSALHASASIEIHIGSNTEIDIGNSNGVYIGAGVEISFSSTLELGTALTFELEAGKIRNTTNDVTNKLNEIQTKANEIVNKVNDINNVLVKVDNSTTLMKNHAINVSNAALTVMT